ncbi:MAG TPA: DUF1800 domain-containing protein, partial [Acidimicrobiales bacterium]
RPSDAGGFGDRDESFARAIGEPAVEAPPSTLYDTASEAAAATRVSAPTILATDDPVLHLLRRATWGGTPALVDEVHEMGIDAWIAQQLDPESIPDDVADGVWGQFRMATMSPVDIQRSVERYAWDAMFEYGKATFARQIWSRRQLYEVMVDFWANHLNVPVPGPSGWDVGPAYHRDVIRAHALGSFTDMLLAAMQHPAMLRYLTNDESDKDSVNENLGRELLELHTVGVGSGYTELDVRNSAYILTGRSVASRVEAMRDGNGMDMDMGMQMQADATFAYDPAKHWTGPVQVLDFHDENASPEGGFDVGDAYLRHLASHPATANTIARKLAVRFVSDDPPPELVERLATAYLDNGTEITPVLDVLFRSGELWNAVGQKTRRPLENMVASIRVLDVQPGGDTPSVLDALYWSTHQMGHQPLAWSAPNGYPDVRAAWRSASSLLEIWNAHRGLVAGWHEGATYVPADQLVAGRPSGTVGEYVDSLCLRLCGQTFQPAHRDVLIAFVDAGADTPTAQTQMPNLVEGLAPLVLDSPYFALR